MQRLIQIGFGIGMLLVLAGVVGHSRGEAWGQYLIFAGIAAMVPFFFRRSANRNRYRRRR